MHEVAGKQPDPQPRRVELELLHIYLKANKIATSIAIRYFQFYNYFFKENYLYNQKEEQT